MPGTPKTVDQLVIAVDGLSYAGKTTLVHGLARQVGGVAVAEYSELAPLPPFPHRDHDDVVAGLRHFLRLECDRTAFARQSGAPVVLLDRSPLTLITYEYGLSTLGVPTDSGYAADLYSTAAESGAIFIPDGYIYLRVPETVTAQRTLKRGPIAAHLTAPSVHAGIEAAAAQFLAALPAGRRLELDGDRPKHELLREAEEFVAALPGQTTALPSWRVLAAGIGTGREATRG